MNDEEILLPLNSYPPLSIFDAIYGRSREDAFIAMGSLRPGRMGDLAPRYLFPLSVSDRHDLLPTIFEYCINQTQYICPNTLRQSALMGKPDSYFREGLDLGHPQYFQASNDHVYELCAVTVDLDVGRGPDSLSPGQAIGCVLDLCLRRELVWPSLVALSGRGCYLMFLLRDENSIRPPLNTEDNRVCWKLICNELVTRLQHLEADHNAKRLANWYKRPGTIDLKTGNEVVYMTLSVDDLANVPIYRMSALMKFLHLHHEAEPCLIQPVKPKLILPPSPVPPMMPSASDLARLKEPVRKVQRGKGSEPYKRRAAEIELLSQYRQGMPEGLRNTTLFHYFQSRRAYLAMTYQGEQDGAARAYADAMDATFRLNRTFRPPLPDREVQKACVTKKGRRMARSATIAADLRVTPEEVEKIGLVAIVPADIKATRKNRDERIKKKNRQFQDELQSLVDGMIQEGKDAPEIIATVKANLMKDISRQYVHARRKRLAAAAPPVWFED